MIFATTALHEGAKWLVSGMDEKVSEFIKGCVVGLGRWGSSENLRDMKFG